MHFYLLLEDLTIRNMAVPTQKQKTDFRLFTAGNMSVQMLLE